MCEKVISPAGRGGNGSSQTMIPIEIAAVGRIPCFSHTVRVQHECVATLNCNSLTTPTTVPVLVNVSILPLARRIMGDYARHLHMGVFPALDPALQEKP
jgi:hypothetical protein